jgi:hypothetical protein
MQLGQILPYQDCIARLPVLAPISWAFALMSLASGYVSWRASRQAFDLPHVPAFIGSLSGLAGLLFAFALALQGLASTVLSGCER